jgi:hypothetical protein
MPRFFAPTNGFTDKSIAAIRIETIDGHPNSVEVRTDGSERNLGMVGRESRWVPTWGEQELENLVREGTWKELGAVEIAGLVTAPGANVAASIVPPPDSSPATFTRKPKQPAPLAAESDVP